MTSCVQDSYGDLQFITKPSNIGLGQRGGSGHRGGFRQRGNGAMAEENDWPRDRVEKERGAFRHGTSENDGWNSWGGGARGFRGYPHSNHRQDGGGRGYQQPAGRDLQPQAAHDRSDRGRQVYNPRGGRGRGQGQSDLVDALRSLVNQGYGGGYNRQY